MADENQGLWEALLSGELFRRRERQPARARPRVQQNEPAFPFPVTQIQGWELEQRLEAERQAEMARRTAQAPRRREPETFPYPRRATPERSQELSAGRTSPPAVRRLPAAMREVGQNISDFPLLGQISLGDIGQGVIHLGEEISPFPAAEAASAPMFDRPLRSEAIPPPHPFPFMDGRVPYAALADSAPLTEEYLPVDQEPWIDPQTGNPGRMGFAPPDAAAARAPAYLSNEDEFWRETLERVRREREAERASRGR